ncbi:Uncharacterized protein DBV15_06050 [Temnothorax longispinosus]|uniref:ABC transporter domain-containing protein n=1 Tax=Temnothorax longispinosus TaxID=300112 RepID=A0A4S2KZT3_9HYME|nr:Uncharacterized protein DBV15_06050 [Temnothorax longispinosus]
MLTVETEILRNVTGHFESGKLTVIIGPSGAGKTTLLKVVLDERLTDVKGIVTINGVERDRGMVRKHVRYVPQQFDLLPFLTTRETLYIAARLKLVNQDEQVNDIAKSLSLSNCMGTLANKLSGGERKRLSIGVELIAKPSVLLLDEPTSGLDSAVSNQLINMLHGMARENCTVVCVIHQPSRQMISLFDDIMVLNQGRSMYCGPKSEILNTYSIAGFTCPSFYNTAEFVLEVITEQRGGDLENLYKICRDEYENSRSRNRPNENESTDSKQKCETGDIDMSTNSLFLIPAVSTPLALFAGFFLKFKDIPAYLQPLSTVSFYRYSFEGMMQAVYLNRSQLPCSEIYCFFSSPNKILSMMDMPTVPFYVILIMCIRDRVNDIAESLSLSNSLDTLAKKLSGGERKRLSIGVEMITKPSYNKLKYLKVQVNNQCVDLTKLTKKLLK